MVRACATCGAPFEPTRARQRRCAEHAGQDDPRPDSTARGYDHRWSRTRAAYLRAHPHCECGCGQPAVDVHHIDSLGPSGPAGHDSENLMALAHDCHSRVTRRNQLRRDTD